MRSLSGLTFKVRRAGSEDPESSSRRKLTTFAVPESNNVMRRLQVAAVWLILMAAATYLFLFDPAKGGFPSCPFRTLTGWQCPGCGATRGLHQLLHGHPMAAFELNPLMVLSLPFLAVVLLGFTRSSAGNGTRVNPIPARYGWFVLVVVVGFWIFRNTPLYPFTS